MTMPASLNMPPRHTQEHFEALSPERLSLGDSCAIIGLLALASWGIIYAGLTLAGWF